MDKFRDNFTKANLRKALGYEWIEKWNEAKDDFIEVK